MRDDHYCPCAQIDHGYAEVLLIWCPHRDGWTLRWATWREAASTEVDGHETGAVFFGLDAAHDVLVDYAALQLEDLAYALLQLLPVQGARARLPGFEAIGPFTDKGKARRAPGERKRPPGAPSRA